MARGLGESIVKENPSSTRIRIHPEGLYGLTVLESTSILEVPSSTQESKRSVVVVNEVEALLCDLLSRFIFGKL